METTVDSNIKRLVAVDKKYHQAPVFITPKEDPSTRKVIDYKSKLSQKLQDSVTISLEPKRDRDDNVIDEMSVRAYHLQVFDLNNPNDALLFEVIKDDKMIALSKEAINPDRHRFYIEDKEKEATQTISKSKLKGKAFASIANLSMEEMLNYARILGKYTTNLSSTQVESALYQIAEDKPQLILDVSNDKNLKHKIFLKKLLEANIIYMDNGKYMNGKDLLGINEDYTIQWLKDPLNSSIVTQWHKMMKSAPMFEEPRIQDMDKVKPASDLSVEPKKENESESPKAPAKGTRKRTTAKKD